MNGEQQQMPQSIEAPKLIVSLRGRKCDDFVWNVNTSTVLDLKLHLSNSSVVKELGLQSSDIKLIHKGKVLSDDSASLHNLLIGPPSSKKSTTMKPIRLMATGVSKQEVIENEKTFNQVQRTAPRIKDDLSDVGKAQIASRQRLGRRMLQQAFQRDSSKSSSKSYKFHKVETLPMLPNQQKAKQILEELANDPGILACMAKHKWNVGCLAELYPKGQVGQSPVCVMGLNQNKGQKILLRLRTDDLQGFRKILSIRKVLYHELAHNVHSDHDNQFFQLMRQIEKECNELVGIPSTTTTSDYYHEDRQAAFAGGTYTLGGGSSAASSATTLSKRELVARAAMMRLSREEQEIQDACGCGGSGFHLIEEALPVHSESITTEMDVVEDENMDEEEMRTTETS